MKHRFPIDGKRWGAHSKRTATKRLLKPAITHDTATADPWHRTVDEYSDG